MSTRCCYTLLQSVFFQHFRTLIQAFDLALLQTKHYRAHVLFFVPQTRAEVVELKFLVGQMVHSI